MQYEKSGENMVQRVLTIEYRSLATLRFDSQNPRVHNKKQVRQIARSIEVFGFNVPVLIDSQGQLIAGHGRVQAAQLIGMTDVPTIILENMTEAQIRAFMIADNRLTENAIWDDRLLAEQLKALSSLDLNFNVEVTGFEISEIDLMIEGLTPASNGHHDPADSLTSSTEPQVSRTGDLWVLNRHRIYCGDSRNSSAYSELMAGERAHMVFTDPPYNDPIDGYVTGFGKIHHPEFAVASGEMSQSEFTDFLTTTLTQLAQHSRNGSLHFVCMDWRHTPELLAAARSVYSEFKNLCVWVKDTGGQGSLYRSQHELVFVFKSGKEPHRNNIQLGQFGRYRTNVWQYRRVNTASRSSDEQLSAVHPTIKPVELVADAILDCTARSEIVLDAFLGSGTTVMAAERTGRACYGMELSPHYVDTVVRRWQAFTGQIAVQESTGRTFNQVQEERHGRSE
jgi:DNA modification methylase